MMFIHILEKLKKEVSGEIAFNFVSEVVALDKGENEAEYNNFDVRDKVWAKVDSCFYSGTIENAAAKHQNECEGDG
ncbi:MAG: hypothetical protein ACPL07_01205 [Candidatus Bathyarchaeia archaeon]